MTTKIEEIKNYSGPYKVTHFTDHLLEKIQKVGSSHRFKSTFPVFDGKLDGIETGEVVVVSGETKQGKTLFVESWLNGLRAKSELVGTLIFTYEVQPERLLAKYVNNEKTRIYLPMELKTMDFDWLKERCLEAAIKYNCNVVMIDHLHFLVDMNTRQNMSLNIGAFMRRLKKEIAQDLNMAVILIAHQGQTKENQGASIRNIRDSSFVGQESDAIIIVSRKKNYDNVDLKDIENKSGTKKMEEIKARIKIDEKDPIEDNYSKDNYSMGLAMVSIERARRSGVFEFKKVFIKKGEFLEEL